jgi:two-component system sensor histidine kinase PilS (NtrC family)
MRPSAPKYEDRDLGSFCRLMIILRVICVGAALSVIAFLMATGLGPDGMMPVVGLLLVVFPLSAVWWMLYKAGYSLRTLISAQLMADLLVEGGLVYLTGGAYSHLTVVFLVTIFVAGILLWLRGALIAATVSTALLTAASLVRGVDTGEVVGMPPGGRATAYFILSIAFESAFFYVVAVLSGHVSQRARAFGVKLKTTTTELQRARMDTSLIIESMNSGLVTISEDWVITEVNQAASRILGVAGDRVRGLRVQDVLGDVAPEMVGKMIRALEEGIDEKRAEVYASNAGHKIPLGVSVSPMSDNEGRRTGVVCVLQDLSEVKSMEEKVRLADRLAALGELSAGIAHEIRTPLASICGSVEMLRDSLSRDGEERKLVDLVVKESERLRNIIDHFLQFAKFRPARFGRVPLNAILSEVVCMVENHPRFAEGMSVHLDVDDSAYIFADEENVKQVFYNLAVNAIEAMGVTGRLEIRVDTDAERDSRRFARVAFTDDGEGMDEDTQAQAFRPFYTGKKSGTGLGLAIVSKILAEHGGSIEMVSTRGKGTVVSVYLPLERNTLEAGFCGAIQERGLAEDTKC